MIIRCYGWHNIGIKTLVSRQKIKNEYNTRIYRRILLCILKR